LRPFQNLYIPSGCTGQFPQHPSNYGHGPICHYTDSISDSSTNEFGYPTSLGFTVFICKMKELNEMIYKAPPSANISSLVKILPCSEQMERDPCSFKVGIWEQRKTGHIFIPSF
jgi:hypothetical protein